MGLGPRVNSDPLVIYKGWTLKIKTRKIAGLNGLTRAGLDPLWVETDWI